MADVDVVARRPRTQLSLFVPLLLIFGALAIIAATLPFSGVHIPGERRLQAVLARIPQPWKPPKPVYVAAPDPADAAAALVPAAPAAPAPGTAAGAAVWGAAVGAAGAAGMATPAAGAGAAG